MSEQLMAEEPKDQFEAAELGILRGALAQRYPWADWANYRTVDRNGDVFDWEYEPYTLPKLRAHWLPYDREGRFVKVANAGETIEVWNLLIVKKP